MTQAVSKSSSVTRGAETPVSLEKALRGLLPNASRPLTLSAAAFAGSGAAKASVLVNVDVGAFANAAESAMPLEFAVTAVNQTGRQVAYARETATVTFKPATGNRRAEANVQTHVELPPGDYEVRVAVSDPATGISASVFGPVAVPLFGSASLSLSDVIVESSASHGPRRPLRCRRRRRDACSSETKRSVRSCRCTRELNAPTSSRRSPCGRRSWTRRDGRFANSCWP